MLGMNESDEIGWVASATTCTPVRSDLPVAVLRASFLAKIGFKILKYFTEKMDQVKGIHRFSHASADADGRLVVSQL